MRQDEKPTWDDDDDFNYGDEEEEEGGEDDYPVEEEVEEDAPINMVSFHVYVRVKSSKLTFRTRTSLVSSQKRRRNPRKIRKERRRKMINLITKPKMGV